MIEGNQRDPATIAWFAGLFEGEGCIYIGDSYVQLTINMTDLDVIERVHALFPGPKIAIINPSATELGTQRKTQYCWRVNKQDDIRDILTLSLPWFGKRRAVIARKALAFLDARPGHNSEYWWERMRQYWGDGTQCRQGHKLTSDNVYIAPGTTSKRCKLCRRAADQRRRRKRLNESCT